MRPKIRTKMRQVLLVGIFLFGCGATASRESLSPPKREQEVVAIVMTPTDAERQGGGVEVVINASDAVRDWVSSPAFDASSWEKNENQLPPRYVVSFRGRDGEVARYYMGTLRGKPLAYRCFGLCDTWWSAPSRTDGSHDPLRYRVLGDEIWHPLARQWYLSSK